MERWRKKWWWWWWLWLSLCPLWWCPAGPRSPGAKPSRLLTQAEPQLIIQREQGTPASPPCSTHARAWKGSLPNVEQCGTFFLNSGRSVTTSTLKWLTMRDQVCRQVQTGKSSVRPFRCTACADDAQQAAGLIQSLKKNHVLPRFSAPSTGPDGQSSCMPCLSVLRACSSCTTRLVDVCDPLGAPKCFSYRLCVGTWDRSTCSTCSRCSSIFRSHVWFVF